MLYNIDIQNYIFKNMIEYSLVLISVYKCAHNTILLIGRMYTDVNLRKLIACDQECTFVVD